MKKIIKVFFLFSVISILYSCLNFSYAENKTFSSDEKYYSYFGYTTENNTVTITDYNGEVGGLTKVIIPDYIEGKPVVEISAAFDHCHHLKEVIIPDSVTKIGDNAFFECNKLNTISTPSKKIVKGEVKLPDGLKEIGESAFCGANLNKIIIPKQIKYIEAKTFIGCDNLKDLVLPNGLISIEEEAFQSCGIQTLTIPNSVKKISRAAFSNCEYLKTLVIPTGVDNIESHAFSECYNLKLVTIEDGLKSMDRNTFADCTKLEGIIIPESVTIGDGYGNINKNTIIYGIKGSSAETFAKDEYLTFKTVSNIAGLKYSSKTSSITLSWNKVTGAKGYEIWRYNSSSKTYKKLKTITSGSTLSYTNSNLLSASQYKYKIRSYKTVKIDNKNIKYYGKFTKVITAQTKLATPSITLSNPKKGSVRITWKNTASKSNGYEIYRATSKNGKYTKITTINDNNKKTYIDNRVISNKTYYYKIRSYKQLNSKNKIYSSFSTVKYIKIK